MQPREHVSGNLKTLRKEARLSQKEFLARLRDDLGMPMDQTTLSKKENQDRALNIDELLCFAAVLNVSPVELLLPRHANEGLELGSLPLPAPKAREWIRGWRPLNEFHGVPDAALVLPDQETRDTIKQLEAEIEHVDTEIRVRENLIREAEVQIEDLWTQPTLADTPDSNLAGEPFEQWVEQAHKGITELKTKRTELQDEAKTIERQAQDRGWMHRDPPLRSP